MRRAKWLQALTCGEVWLRASKIGLPVGLLQAVINQGDVWMSHSVDRTVVIKTIVSPLVTFSVALCSSAATYVQQLEN